MFVARSSSGAVRALRTGARGISAAAAACRALPRQTTSRFAAARMQQPVSSAFAVVAQRPSAPVRGFSADYVAKDIVTPSKAFVGKPAPFFADNAVMPDGSFKKISLSDYQGKWLVLFSYPLDFTFVCPTEIVDYSDHYQQFKELNCEVVAFSVDSVFSHLAWTNTPRKEGGVGKLNIPLLSDGTHQISRDYGVLTEVGPNLRGLYLIDPKGNLRHVTVNDPPVGRNPAETLRLLQAFQFVEKHGEVCPSGWTPGSASMKADPKGSKEYFEKVNKD